MIAPSKTFSDKTSLTVGKEIILLIGREILRAMIETGALEIGKGHILVTTSGSDREAPLLTGSGIRA